MSFFVSTYQGADEPRPERPRPAWTKPEDVLPRLAAIDVVLVHTDAVAIGLSGLWCYPNGFDFGVEVVLREADRRGRLNQAMNLHHMLEPGEPIPPEMLRVGLRFADGRTVTNLPGQPFPDGETDRPILFGGGRGAGPHTQSHQFWVHPLPPPGPLTIVVEWPYFQVGEVVTTIDAQVVLDAAARAEVLWPR